MAIFAAKNFFHSDKPPSFCVALSSWLIFQPFCRLGRLQDIHWTPPWAFTTTNSVNFRAKTHPKVVHKGVNFHPEVYIIPSAILYQFTVYFEYSFRTWNIEPIICTAHCGEISTSRFTWTTMTDEINEHNFVCCGCKSRYRRQNPSVPPSMHTTYPCSSVSSTSRSSRKILLKILLSVVLLYWENVVLRQENYM